MQVFWDHFSVYGNKENHLQQLQKCSEECHVNGINLNPKNVCFCVNYGVSLGHIVCNEGLLVDPQKIIAITTMLAPTNVIEIKKILGASCFY